MLGKDNVRVVTTNANHEGVSAPQRYKSSGIAGCPGSCCPSADSSTPSTTNTKFLLGGSSLQHNRRRFLKPTSAFGVSIIRSTSRGCFAACFLKLCEKPDLQRTAAKLCTKPLAVTVSSAPAMQKCQPATDMFCVPSASFSGRLVLPCVTRLAINVDLPLPEAPTTQISGCLAQWRPMLVFESFADNSVKTQLRDCRPSCWRKPSM
mmetsp:Transcript_67762/g.107381  ORF Transcript_67762/g.107381 Transcript_67762/m.107381 type:complete len:206 (-) Transcript_67762:832-1449(-)